jgi:hypothetical protein
MHDAKRYTRAGISFFCAWAALIALTGITGAGVAQATSSTALPVVHFHSTATVRGDGAGAVVTLTISCPGLASGPLEIGVWQDRHGQPLSSASGFAVAPCGKQPHTVTEPLCTGCSGEDASFGGDQPLSPGPASAQAFFLDCSVPGCVGRYLAVQPVTLVQNASLDHPASATARLQPHGRLVAGGAAADIFLTALCRNGVAGLPDPGQSNIGLFQRVSTGSVGEAYSILGPIGHCVDGTAHYHVRLYAQYEALKVGPAFVIWNSLWRQVLLQ